VGHLRKTAGNSYLSMNTPSLHARSFPQRNGLTRRQALGALGALALPWDNLFGQAGSPASSINTTAGAALPPDLVNLHPVMQWIADEQRPLQLSFLDSRWRSLETWKQAARPFFRERLQYGPNPLPLRADFLRREERDGFTLEVVNISATPAYHIPARVLVPKGRRGRLPAVVAIHDHGGRYVWGHEKLISYPDDSEELRNKRAEAYGRPWAEALVRRGYIVIVIDGFYFGERRLRVEDLVPDRVIPEARDSFKAARTAARESTEWHRAINRTCSLYEHLTAKNLIAAGATWPGLHAWDDMRTVDYLISRPDVDRERIGAAGLSIGGLRTAHLIAADPRIKAASITGWMTQFAQQHRNHLRNHTWMILIPGLYGSMDFPDIASLHAPGALLVQQCQRDALYPLEAMRGAVDRLTRIYAKAGIAERFRGTFYDTPHVFQPHMQEEAFDWFDRWL
jgi:dienelactone hydrolase